MSNPNDMGLSCHVDTFEQDMLKALRVHFPEEVIRTVDRHDGEFGEDEIARYAVRANALILASDGGKSQRLGGPIGANIMYDLWVMVTGDTVRQRTRGSRLIVEHALKLLHGGSSWATSEEAWKDPEDVQFKNLYGTETDEMGLSLWVIRWNQFLEIPYIVDPDTLDDFATFYAKYVRPGEEDPDDPDNIVAEDLVSLPTE